MPDENTLSIIERAEKLNQATAEAETRIAAHRATIEEMETKRIMGGQTTVQPTAEVKVETAKEYSEKVMTGKIGKK